MKKILLWIISFPLFSRLWGKAASIRRPRFLVRFLVTWYSRKFAIDMTQYRGAPEDYPSLQEFFIRPLDPATRPLKETPGVLASPADGVFSSLETVYTDAAAQVKGVSYSLSEFLARDLDFSAGYHVAVIYLSPANYHRYHYPLNGKAEHYRHTSGRLYPVNRLGLHHIRGLFNRNERVIVEFSHQPGEGKTPLHYHAVAVGATNVGSIKMEFIHRTPPRDTWVACGQTVRQMDEMGRFEMGSTIVLVIPAAAATPVPNLAGKPIRVGDPIFYLT